jgi:hypothetical protein
LAAQRRADPARVLLGGQGAPDRLAGERLGHLARPTMRRLDDALALLFGHGA